MESLDNKLQEIEKSEIIHALTECNFVKARAARKLGITEKMMDTGSKSTVCRLRKWVLKGTEAKSFTGTGNSDA